MIHNIGHQGLVYMGKGPVHMGILKHNFSRNTRLFETVRAVESKQQLASNLNNLQSITYT